MQLAQPMAGIPSRYRQINPLKRLGSAKGKTFNQATAAFLLPVKRLQCSQKQISATAHGVDISALIDYFPTNLTVPAHPIVKNVLFGSK